MTKDQVEIMRMLLRYEFGLEAANEAIRTGKIAELNQALAERTQPEAAYFATENGKRTGYIFFDLTDPAQIPVIAEPLFQSLNSTVEFIPVMNVDDLQRGLAEAAQR
ncbi:MAG: hypothetical protein M3381_10655 [Actinomycetota bacterium]|nr:hypothetical protein [Actinomycetota bacterium]